MNDLDRAVKDALVLGLENDPTAERVLQIATPFIERAFQDQKGRIEKLEAALRKIAAHHRYNAEMASLARKALEVEDD